MCRASNSLRLCRKRLPTDVNSNFRKIWGEREKEIKFLKADAAVIACTRGAGLQPAHPRG